MKSLLNLQQIPPPTPRPRQPGELRKRLECLPVAETNICRGNAWDPHTHTPHRLRSLAHYSQLKGPHHRECPPSPHPSARQTARLRLSESVSADGSWRAQRTFIPRVPQCLSPRPNCDPLNRRREGRPPPGDQRESLALCLPCAGGPEVVGINIQ